MISNPIKLKIEETETLSKVLNYIDINLKYIPDDIHSIIYKCSLHEDLNQYNKAFKVYENTLPNEQELSIDLAL